MTDVFNNREFSIAFWLIIILLWGLIQASFRKAIWNVVRAAVVKKLLAVYLLVGISTFIFCYLLNLIDLWDWGQVKNTVYWYFGIALTSVFLLIAGSDKPTYFRDLVTNNFKFIVLIEFIIAFYTFELWFELIFIPVMFFIGLLIATAGSKKEFVIVKTLLNNLLVMIGLGLMLFTIYKLITEFNEFAQFGTIYDFSTPILLSILLTPFLFIFHRYLAYENITSRLQYIVKNSAQHSYVKKQLFFKLRLNPKKLRLWQELNQNNFLNSKNDVKDSVQKVIAYLSDENNPPKVDEVSGWSPFEARYFLKEFDVETGVYKNIYEDVWHASSPYLEVSEGILPNNIGYYIEGTEKEVKTLKLILNINDKDDQSASHLKLNEISSGLFLKALKMQLPAKLKEALLKSNNYSTEYENYFVSVMKSTWPNNNGYSLKVILGIKGYESL